MIAGFTKSREKSGQISCHLASRCEPALKAIFLVLGQILGQSLVHENVHNRRGLPKGGHGTRFHSRQKRSAKIRNSPGQFPPSLPPDIHSAGTNPRGTKRAPPPWRETSIHHDHDGLRKFSSGVCGSGRQSPGPCKPPSARPNRISNAVTIQVFPEAREKRHRHLPVPNRKV